MRSEPEPERWTPQEVLFRYFHELLALNDFAMAEAQSATRRGRDLDLDGLRQKRAAIREQYCTPRRRKTDNVVAYGPLDAQAYDRSNIVVEREEPQSKTRFQITVRNTALGERWRYTLILREGRWLVDSLQFRDGRKWRPVPLH